MRALVFFLVLALSYSVFAEPQGLECSVCMASVKFVQDVVEEYGNDVIQFIKPICNVIYPFLNQLIGESECDPKIPQTCIDLCEGMIRSWGPLIAGRSELT